MRNRARDEKEWTAARFGDRAGSQFIKENADGSNGYGPSYLSLGLDAMCAGGRDDKRPHNL